LVRVKGFDAACPRHLPGWWDVHRDASHDAHLDPFEQRIDALTTFIGALTDR
jgi:hypothetical protein